MCVGRFVRVAFFVLFTCVVECVVYVWCVLLAFVALFFLRWWWGGGRFCCLACLTYTWNALFGLVGWLGLIVCFLLCVFDLYCSVGLPCCRLCRVYRVCCTCIANVVWYVCRFV